MSEPKNLNQAASIGGAYLMFMPDGKEVLPEPVQQGGGIDLSLLNPDSELYKKFMAKLSTLGPDNAFAIQWKNEVDDVVRYFRKTGNGGGNLDNAEIISWAELTAGYQDDANPTAEDYQTGAQKIANVSATLQMASSILAVYGDLADVSADPNAFSADNFGGIIAPGLKSAASLGNAYLMYMPDSAEDFPDTSVPEEGLDLTVFDTPEHQRFQEWLKANNPDLAAEWDEQIAQVVSYFKTTGNQTDPTHLTEGELKAGYSGDTERISNAVQNLKMASRILERYAGQADTFEAPKAPITVTPGNEAVQATGPGWWDRYGTYVAATLGGLLLGGLGIALIRNRALIKELRGQIDALQGPKKPSPEGPKGPERATTVKLNPQRKPINGAAEADLAKAVAAPAAPVKTEETAAPVPAKPTLEDVKTLMAILDPELRGADGKTLISDAERYAEDVYRRAAALPSFDAGNLIDLVTKLQIADYKAWSQDAQEPAENRAKWEHRATEVEKNGEIAKAFSESPKAASSAGK